MNKQTCAFNQSRDAFLKALSEYQAATRDMNIALQRVSRHTHTFYGALHSVVHISGSMIASRSSQDIQNRCNTSTPEG